MRINCFVNNLVGAQPRLIFIACLALGLLLPAFSIGFLSDDFSWLNIVLTTRNHSWLEYLLVPSPYGYFRPLPMIIFRLIGLQFPEAAWPFRLLILGCHLITCLLVYILGRRLKYDRDTSLLASIIFAILPCHAESLFWIASLNELLASLFILTAMYCLLRGRSWLSDAATVLLFTLAMFTRESAFCYLPLVLLLSLKEPTLRRPGLIPILLLPGLAYLSARLWWLSHLPAAVPVSAPGQMDLSPIGLAYRLLHYLTAMLLPVKAFFDLVGFEHHEYLRFLVLNTPQAKLLLGGSMFLLALCVLAVTLIKLRPGPMIWPGPIFAIAALMVYLPFSHTSEHFLYLPSIGTSYALAFLLTTVAQRWRTWASILTILTISIYLGGYGIRLHRWQQASRAVEHNLSHLESLLADVPSNGRVLVEGLNNRYFGIPFIGEHCLNDAWVYRFPERKIIFYFEPTRDDPYHIVYSPISFSFTRRH